MPPDHERPLSDEELRELAARKLDPPPPPDQSPSEYSETLKALLASKRCKRIVTSGPSQVFMVSSRTQLEDVKRALNLA